MGPLQKSPVPGEGAFDVSPMNFDSEFDLQGWFVVCSCVLNTSSHTTYYISWVPSLWALGFEISDLGSWVRFYF